MAEPVLAGTGPVVLATSAVVTMSFLGAGAVAWRARPGNRTGPLLVAVGIAWAVARLPYVVDELAAPVTPGVALAVALGGGWWAALLAHVVVAFPTGRLGAAAPPPGGTRSPRCSGPRWWRRRCSPC
jgi:hypothetical protein